MYDVYGNQGLNFGITENDGSFRGGYHYAGNAYSIFEKFFGSSNPFALIKDTDRRDDCYATMLGSSFGGIHYSDKSILPPVIVDLQCTLEELYCGSIKKMPYSKRVLNDDGRITKALSITREIKVFRGYGNSTVLKYAGEGNQDRAHENC